MALNIKDAEVDRLARQLSKRTGESITGAVRTALKERLKHLPKKAELGVGERLVALSRRTAALPVLTDKSGKELVDELYDKDGLPR